MKLKKKVERYLRVSLLGPGPRLMKKELPSCGLTKVEKNWCRVFVEGMVYLLYEDVIFWSMDVKEILLEILTFCNCTLPRRGKQVNAVPQAGFEFMIACF